MFLTLSGFCVKESILVNGTKVQFLYVHFVANDEFSGSSYVMADGKPVFNMVYKGSVDDILPTLSVGSIYDVTYYYDRTNKGCICTKISDDVEKED